MRNYLSMRSNKLPISALLPKKTLLILLLLALCTVVLLLTSAGLGEVNIHPIDVLKVLFGSGTEQDQLLIQTFRLPRILVGFLVGASLGVAGAIMQGIVRNPLASPDLLGITGGASVTAVAFITLFPSLSIKFLPLAALLGAGIIALLLYGFAWKRGVTSFRLVMIGIGLKALTAALTTMLIVLSPIELKSKVVIWLTGSVYGTTWDDVLLLSPWFVVLMFLSAVYGRHINVLQLGDSIATGAGSAVQRYQLHLVLICIGLSGAAVAIGGAIGFVALLAPHIAKQLVGPVFEGVLPASALVGGLIVLGGDLIARTAFSPLDIPVGAITSAVGAPFFIYLLYKSRS